jgi:putative chitobiose transport system permease protein
MNFPRYIYNTVVITALGIIFNVLLSSLTAYPLAAALTFLNGQFSYNFGWIAAGTMISVLPIIIVFLFTQRYYMEGIAGAIKG